MNSAPPITAPPPHRTADDLIAEQVANFIGTDLDDRQIRTALRGTGLTEVEQRIVIREVRAARAFVDTHEARVRAGWIDADNGGCAA